MDYLDEALARFPSQDQSACNDCCSGIAVVSRDGDVGWRWLRSEAVVMSSVARARTVQAMCIQTQTACISVQAQTAQATCTVAH